jgi:hypothetical protein
MDLIAIRQRLEQLIDPQAQLPTPAEWIALKRAWQEIKPQCHTDYWPTIDDRIAQVESMAARLN